MKEKELDCLNFILGSIKVEPYLTFYFDTMIKRMHLKTTLTDAIKAFEDLRREVKDDKIKNKDKKDYLATTVIITHER